MTYPAFPLHFPAQSLPQPDLQAAFEHLRAQNPQTLLERSRVLLSPAFRPLTALEAQAVFSAWTYRGMN